MNKIIIWAILSVLAGLTLWFLFPGEEKITNYPPRGGKIVAFGDSLVEGVGSTKGNDFVSLTSKQIGLPIVNLGKSGDTTASALERFPSVLLEEPDITLVLLGGNDSLRRLPISDTEANLRQIIGKLQNAGSVTILLGVRGGILGDPYQDMYEAVAKSTGSVYISDVLKGLFGRQSFMSDAIHPNDKGYAVIAGRVALVLSNLLK